MLENSLPEVSHTRLNALFRLGEHIWAQRPDVRAEFREIESWEYWYWLMWHGTREYKEVRSKTYPLPDEHLIHRVIGAESFLQYHVRRLLTLLGFREAAIARERRRYLESALVDWRRILLCLMEAGLDFVHGAHIMDFGCGCGRILQVFARYTDTCQLYGADVDKQAIRWCNQHLDFAQFIHLPNEPPAPFVDGQFDVVYAFSVFSHLPGDLQRRWLEDLHRVTKPGAILVLTIQGRKVIADVLAGRVQQGFPAAETLRVNLDHIEKTGFAFYPYRDIPSKGLRKRAHVNQWNPDRYGSTFVLAPYVGENWLDMFDLIAFHESPDEWQDYVVLRHR
jgi:SAM-dependent methyltransferase